MIYLGERNFTHYFYKSTTNYIYAISDINIVSNENSVIDAGTSLKWYHDRTSPIENLSKIERKIPFRKYYLADTHKKQIPDTIDNITEMDDFIYYRLDAIIEQLIFEKL